MSLIETPAPNYEIGNRAKLQQSMVSGVERERERERAKTERERGEGGGEGLKCFHCDNNLFNTSQQCKSDANVVVKAIKLIYHRCSEAALAICLTRYLSLI